MDEPTRTTTEIKSILIALDQKMDRRFDAVETRFDSRFNALEGRFTAIDGRFAALETRFTGIDGRFTGLETKFNQWFVALVTLQVTTLLALVAGLFGIVTKLL